LLIHNRSADSQAGQYNVTHGVERGINNALTLLAMLTRSKITAVFTTYLLRFASLFLLNFAYMQGGLCRAS
jgi:hypothetical protein